MKSLRLAIEHTDETIHPMHAFVCESPAVDREIILEGQVSDGVETLLCYVEGDRQAYERALGERADPVDYDITPDEGEGFFMYVRAELGGGGELLADAFDQETVVVASPIEFRADRTMRLTVVGRSADLQRLLDELPAGMGVEVLEIGSYSRGVGPGLTGRQREAVRAAWDAGYYEVPRDGEISDVAAALACSISTASGLLRRAEARLVAAALDEPR